MITEEFKEILDVSRKFTAKEIGKDVLDIDLNPSTDWTNNLWHKGAEVGFPGLLIPEEYGGLGQPELCAALILDVMASECAGIEIGRAHV